MHICTWICVNTFWRGVSLKVIHWRRRVISIRWAYGSAADPIEQAWKARASCVTNCPIYQICVDGSRQSCAELHKDMTRKVRCLDGPFYLIKDSFVVLGLGAEIPHKRLRTQEDNYDKLVTSWRAIDKHCTRSWAPKDRPHAQLDLII